MKEPGGPQLGLGQDPGLKLALPLAGQQGRPGAITRPAETLGAADVVREVGRAGNLELAGDTGENQATLARGDQRPGTPTRRQSDRVEHAGGRRLDALPRRVRIARPLEDDPPDRVAPTPLV